MGWNSSGVFCSWRMFWPGEKNWSASVAGQAWYMLEMKVNSMFAVK